MKGREHRRFITEQTCKGSVNDGVTGVSVKPSVRSFI